jgi:Transposase IS116/IS110/IS902 family
MPVQDLQCRGRRGRAYCLALHARHVLSTTPWMYAARHMASTTRGAGSERFRVGRDFSAWLGSTPRQNSSGGKDKLGSITKKGNGYIRRLLVLGATSLLKMIGKRKGALRDWVVALLARRPARLVTVALANKLARTIWAIMTTGEAFRIETFAKA